ncbi:hypothetical protein D9M70_544140 [compost metagenome]
MGVQAFRHENAIDRAVGLQDDLALGHVEFERLAPVAPAREDPIGLPERLQDRVEDRPGLVIRVAVDRRLCLLVGELGSTLHHDAVEGVAGLAALLGEAHAHGKRRTVDAFLQRAEVV